MQGLRLRGGSGFCQRWRLSSTYGADAVAGVFNVITDTKFEGAKISAQFTGIDKSESWSVQAMIGVGNDRLHSVTSASYRFVDNLQNADRVSAT